MKIENQLCTLAQAEQLKALGINCQSEFVWTNDYGLIEPFAISYKGHVGRAFDKACPPDPRLVEYAAYSAAEVGQMLPGFVAEEYDLTCSKDSMWGGWDTEYSYPRINGGIARFQDKKVYADTEAESKAEMLIWLLQEGHCTAEEIIGHYNR